MARSCPKKSGPSTLLPRKKDEKSESKAPHREAPAVSAPAVASVPAKESELPRIDTPFCLDATGEVVVFGRNPLVALEVSSGRRIAETRLEVGWAESLRFHEGRVVVQGSLGRDSKEPAPVYTWELGAVPVRIGGVDG